MSIESPIIRVECDKCGEVDEYGMTSLAGGGWDDRNLAAAMKRDGWVQRDGRDICSGCIDDEREESDQ